MTLHGNMRGRHLLHRKNLKLLYKCPVRKLLQFRELCSFSDNVSIFSICFKLHFLRVTRDVVSKGQLYQNRRIFTSFNAS